MREIEGGDYIYATGNTLSDLREEVNYFTIRGWVTYGDVLITEDPRAVLMQAMVKDLEDKP